MRKVGKSVPQESDYETRGGARHKRTATQAPSQDSNNVMPPNLDRKRAKVAQPAYGMNASSAAAAAALTASAASPLAAAAKTYLQQFSAQRSSGLFSIVCKNQVTIPRAPQKLLDLLKPYKSATEIHRRHVALLTDAPEAYGTGEVAQWVLRVVEKMLELTATEFCLIAKVSQLNHAAAYEDLETVLQPLRALVRFREATHLFRCLYLTADYLPDTLWKDYIGTCCLSVMSELQAHGKVLVPSDFFHYAPKTFKNGQEVAQVCTGGHATVALLSARQGHLGSVKVQHFETTGFSRDLVQRGFLAHMRKQTLSGPEDIEVQDRGKKFHYFAVPAFAKTLAPQDSDGYKSKAFAQVETTMPFSSLDMKVEMSLASQLALIEEDCARLSPLLFMEFHKGRQTSEASALYQRTVLDPGSFGSKFPLQRLHALQGNSSCELKSTMVALRALMVNESTYQALYLFLIEDCLEGFGNRIMTSEAHKELESLRKERPRADFKLGEALMLEEKRMSF